MEERFRGAESDEDRSRQERRASLYRAKPIDWRNGIPVFTIPDAYSENYERMAADHLEHASRTGENPFIDEELWREAEESTRALIRAHVSPGGRVLDVGVGTGRLLGPLSEYDRHGIDVSWPYLEVAAAAGIECAYSKAEEMPYADGVFDAVACTDVLEHVFEPKVVLDQIRRVLRPGGALILRVPYREPLQGYLAPGFPYELAHLRSFDEHSIRLLLEKIGGLSVLDWTSVGYRPDPLRSKLSLPRGNWTIARLTAALDRIGYGARAVRALYWPIEINVVAVNPEERTERT